jgi:hypothetical protein
MTMVEWGKQLSFFPIYPSMVNLLSHLSHLFRKGNSSVDLALHVSAPRVPPLRMRIEETRRIFLTGRMGRAVKQSQWPVCAAWGPPCV